MIEEFKALTRVFTSRLPYVVFFVTARCNFKCSHCFYWKEIKDSKKEKELKFDEIKKISKNLNKIYYLTLTGGEPTLRKDIVDIIKLFYKQNDVKQLVFLSNGSNPQRLYKISEDILKNCPDMTFSVGLSMDEFGKNHDRIRSVKGSFQKLIKSIQLLKEFKKFPNFELSVITTLMKYNKDNLVEINRFVTEELKIPHNVSYIRGDVRDYRTKGINLEAYKRISKIIEEQGLKRKHNSKFLLIKDYLMQLSKEVIIKVEEKGENVFPCQALKKSVVINERGRVFPCEMLDKSLGDLKDYDYDINKILNTKKAKKIKKWIKKSKCKCTWECIIPLNIAVSLKGKIMLVKKLLNHCKIYLFNKD